MKCINSSDSPEGCGRSRDCAGCVVRSSVNSAFAGKDVRRASGDVVILSGGNTITSTVLVSASVFSVGGVPRALVVVEDISELAELRSMLPICCSCKKIRTPDRKWEDVEVYLKAHSPELSLTHGICPDCAKRLYPEYTPKKRRPAAH